MVEESLWIVPRCYCSLFLIEWITTVSSYLVLSQESGGILLPTVVIFKNWWDFENIMSLKYQVGVEDQVGGAADGQERLAETKQSQVSSQTPGRLGLFRL